MLGMPWRLISLFPLIITVQSIRRPKGFLSIDCGATDGYIDEVTGLTWLPDNRFIRAGNASSLQHLNSGVNMLNTLRFFPHSGNAHNKYCYALPVLRRRRYLVRTSYYYGGYDGGKSPPVFDQIIEGTKWSTVNTTADYLLNLYTYYEIIVETRGKSLSVCLAPNAQTIGNPFVSGLEMRLLQPSMYNTTDFKTYALSGVARHIFGYSQPKSIRYPDDKYDRIWNPFTDSHRRITISRNNISTTDIWNQPPFRIFQAAVTVDKPRRLEIQWPPNEILAASSYYIALYFLGIDHRGDRIFNISINGDDFFSMLNVYTTPLAVYSSQRQLSGLTKLALDPAAKSNLGPIISAAEMFQLVGLGGRTLTKDVMSLNELKKNWRNVPSDWEGDPCLPTGYSWTGITCTIGKRIRVVMLNLTNSGLTGSLSPCIANLTALTDIWLGSNNLSGPIPDLISLRRLTTLHLDNNRFSGEIPTSLADINNLRQLSLQNNNLSGPIPEQLKKKDGLNFRCDPGNKRLVRPVEAASEAPAGSLTNDCERKSIVDMVLILGVGLISWRMALVL